MDAHSETFFERPASGFFCFPLVEKDFAEDVDISERPTVSTKGITEEIIVQRLNKMRSEVTENSDEFCIFKLMKFIDKCLYWLNENQETQDTSFFTSKIYEILKCLKPHQYFNDFSGNDITMTDISMYNIQISLYNDFDYCDKNFNEYVNEVDSCQLTFEQLTNIVNVHNIAIMIKW